MDLKQAEVRLRALQRQRQQALADYDALVASCPSREFDRASRALPDLVPLEREIAALEVAIERHKP